MAHMTRNEQANKRSIELGKRNKLKALEGIKDPRSNKTSQKGLYITMLSDKKAGYKFDATKQKKFDELEAIYGNK